MGKPPLPPLVLLHGIIFTCWLVHRLSQVTLVAAKRTDLHRRLGALGAVLAVLMIVVGIIYGAKHGFPPRSRPLVFLAVSIFDILVFSILVAAGFYYRRQAETHERLMLLATIAILDAAIGRLPRFHRGSDATSTNPPHKLGAGLTNKSDFLNAEAVAEAQSSEDGRGRGRRLFLIAAPKTAP